jgi:hypothetical protein
VHVDKAVLLWTDEQDKLILIVKTRIDKFSVSLQTLVATILDLPRQFFDPFPDHTTPRDKYKIA